MLGQDYHVETMYMYMSQVLYFTHRWLEVARRENLWWRMKQVGI